MARAKVGYHGESCLGRSVHYVCMYLCMHVFIYVCIYVTATKYLSDPPKEDDLLGSQLQRVSISHGCEDSCHSWWEEFISSAVLAGKFD